MNDIEIIFEGAARKHKPAIPAGRINSFVDGILKELNIDNWQMSVMLTGDNGIRNYNKQWRALDEATDVLSFVQDEGESIPGVPEMLDMPKAAGDIIVSLDTVARNAKKWGSSYDEELRRVFVHGILHLNGMDHPEDDYESGMLKKQEELLAKTRSLIQKDT